jgi:trk system potassium uptake protein TrkH
MWLRLRLADLRIIAHYVGLFVVGIGVVMIVPLVTALIYREWDPALDYLIGMGACFAVGGALALSLTREARLRHSHALALTALGWLAASAAAAVPLALSGNYASALDAYFDAISGLTTSGLTLVVDLDHMAYSHIMWRQITHLIGGQGIVVAALSLAVGLRGGAFSLYLAEGRDERILPNVLYTTRFIWFVTAVYVVFGTVVLWGLNLWLGMSADRAGLEAFWIAIAAYDTGGFGPRSMNAMYYHNWAFEVVAVLLMIAGTMNFNLHAQVWRGGRQELWKNIETRVLAIDVFLLSLLLAIGLAATKVFDFPSAAVRKGVFHLFSAHTGTGLQSVYPTQWGEDFGGAALAAIMLAMAAGGAVSSTAGGIKALRIGLLFKSLVLQVRVALAPRTAKLAERYHHLNERFLTPEMTATAALIAILYAITFITGALIGAAYGYQSGDALFESISAAANVGLSTGITMPEMPVGLKLTYIVQMWAGRLEYIAVLTLFAQLILALGSRTRRGRR